MSPEERLGHTLSWLRENDARFSNITIDLLKDRIGACVCVWGGGALRYNKQQLKKCTAEKGATKTDWVEYFTNEVIDELYLTTPDAYSEFADTVLFDEIKELIGEEGEGGRGV